MRVDSATRAVLKDIEKEPTLKRGSDDIAVVRATYDWVFSAWTAGARAPTNENWVQIEHNGHKTRALVVEPEGSPAKASIMFLHGGGWSLGTALCYAPLCRTIAAESGMRVICPDFPQAPENPFPAAYEVLVAAVEWTISNLEGPFFLCGDSAGGTLAAAISYDKRVSQKIRGQALFYPVLDLRINKRYRSRRRLGTGKYFLTEEGILGAIVWYCGEEGDPNDPRISPILTDRPEITPATFILLPDFDPLKDEGEKYAALLKKAGVPVEVFRAKNTIHGCVSFSGRIPQGYMGIERAAAFFNDLL